MQRSKEDEAPFNKAEAKAPDNRAFIGYDAIADLCPAPSCDTAAIRNEEVNSFPVAQGSLKPCFQVTNASNTQSPEQFSVSSWPENNSDEVIAGSLIMIQKEAGKRPIKFFFRYWKPTAMLEGTGSFSWSAYLLRCWKQPLNNQLYPLSPKHHSWAAAGSLSCTGLRRWQNGQNKQPQWVVALAQSLPWQIKTESHRKILVCSFMNTFSFKWPWGFLR